MYVLDVISFCFAHIGAELVTFRLKSLFFFKYQHRENEWQAGNPSAQKWPMNWRTLKHRNREEGVDLFLLRREYRMGKWKKKRKEKKETKLVSWLRKLKGYSRGESTRSTERAKARMSEKPVAAAGFSPSGWETMASRRSLAAVGFNEEGGWCSCCRFLSTPACWAWALAGASPPWPWSARRCMWSMDEKQVGRCRACERRRSGAYAAQTSQTRRVINQLQRLRDASSAPRWCARVHLSTPSQLLLLRRVSPSLTDRSSWSQRKRDEFQDKHERYYSSYK